MRENFRPTALNPLTQHTTDVVTSADIRERQEARGTNTSSKFLRTLMTASLSAPYALPGETQPSQPAHQKGLPPAPPHASAVVPVVPEKAKASTLAPPKPRPLQTKPVAATPVLAPKSESEAPTPLPDVPAMGN